MSGPTILVVEDELTVRMAAAASLREAGYTVIEAQTGEQARELVSQYANDLALVFSDVMMPGSLDGIGLAQWVRKHHPHIKVILASGAIKLGQLPRDELDGIPVLDKPYLHDKLVERIHRLLMMRAGTRS